MEGAPPSTEFAGHLKNGLPYLLSAFGQISQLKCLIPISQRAAKAVRAKTLRVLVVFCGAAPLGFRLPDGLIYVSIHSHSQFVCFFFIFYIFLIEIRSET